jgi:hypothetical protein
VTNKGEIRFASRKNKNGREFKKSKTLNKSEKIEMKVKNSGKGRK